MTSSLLLQVQVVQIRVCIIYITQPVWHNLPQMQEKEHYLSSSILSLQLLFSLYFSLTTLTFHPICRYFCTDECLLFQLTRVCPCYMLLQAKKEAILTALVIHLQLFVVRPSNQTQEVKIQENVLGQER